MKRPILFRRSTEPTDQFHKTSFSKLGISYADRLFSRFISLLYGKKSSYVITCVPSDAWSIEFSVFPDHFRANLACHKDLYPWQTNQACPSVYKIERFLETATFDRLPEGRRFFMLHGTPFWNVLSIMRHGLQFGADDAIWVSNCLSTALSYAARHGCKKQMYFFIVEVHVATVLQPFNMSSVRIERGCLADYNSKPLFMSIRDSSQVRLRYLVSWKTE